MTNVIDTTDLPLPEYAEVTLPLPPEYPAQEPAGASPEDIASARSQLVVDIDNACVAVYTRFGRFSLEYELREKQAQAYKDAGYSGNVPRQVAAFADRASMAYEPATNLILYQAAGLRTALDNLGDLRMRKYEVIRAATPEAASAAHADILNAIATIAQNIS